MDLGRRSSCPIGLHQKTLPPWSRSGKLKQVVWTDWRFEAWRCLKVGVGVARLASR